MKVLERKTVLSPTQKLAKARSVLFGLNTKGEKIHPSMFDPDVITLCIGDGVQRPHPSVIAAGIRALLDTKNSSLEAYLFMERYEALDQKITEDFAKDGIPNRIARNIIIDCGITRIFAAFFNAVAQKGDTFLTHLGYYHPLAGWCDVFGVDMNCIDTQKNNCYKLNAKDLTKWIKNNKNKKAKGVILFNPTMTGAVYSENELKELGKVLDENNLVSIEDSIFSFTEYEPNFRVPHLAKFRNPKARAVTVKGASKAMNLANLRIGWACGPKALIDKMNKYSTLTMATIPHLSKVMAHAALNAPVKYFRANNEECKLRAELIMGLVDKSNIILNQSLSPKIFTKYIEVEHQPLAGHSILLSFNSLLFSKTMEDDIILDSIDIVKYFLKEAKVCLAPGISHGFSGGLIRVSFGCTGLNKTHLDEVQIENEFQYAIKEVLKFSNRNDRDINKLLYTLKIDESDKRQSFENKYFFYGRKYLKEAFLDRIVPAMLKLLKLNTP